MKQFAVLAIALSLAGLPALSAEENDMLAARWYGALQTADIDTLEALLAANAVIKPNDIAPSQPKPEFVEPMAEWKKAMEGGSIRHKPDGEADGASAYKVCYRFRGNELLTREIFTLSDRKIAMSEQTTLSESCTDF